MKNIVTQRGVEHKHQEPSFVVSGGSITSIREHEMAVAKCGYWVDMYYREIKRKCQRCFRLLE